MDGKALRVLALDLDGTVITADYRLSPRVVAAVARFRAGGRLLVVASGRARASSLPWAERLGGADGIVAFNGGAVYDGEAARDADGQPFFEARLDEGLARDLLAFARSTGLHWHAWSGESWYYERPSPGVDFYEARSGIKGLPRDFSSPSELRWSKLMFVAPDDALASLAPRLRAALGDRAVAVGTGHTLLEVIAPGVSKARGLDAWLARRGLARENVLAFGDAENDLDMLLAAGVGVATADADPAMRARVGRTCPSVNEDGVAVWLEAWLDAESARG